MMDTFTNAIPAWWFGILSAVSLPLGAWVGMALRPRERITSAIMAYGGGALLAALTLELVHEALKHSGFVPLASGMVLGGLTFVGLNQLLNHWGGFMRKTSTLIQHVTQGKRHRFKQIVSHLSKVEILAALSPEEIHALVPHVVSRSYPAGEKIITENTAGQDLFIVESGELEVTQDGRQLARIGPGEIFGEMALLDDKPRQATVTASTPVKLFEVNKQDFDRLISVSPRLESDLRALVNARREHAGVQLAVSREEWERRVLQGAGASAFKPSATELKEAAHATGGAPLAIWLGILLDGIPESAVIGASMVGGVQVSMALIVGLFLANFPESMSSAVGMKKNGLSSWKITWLWMSLCIMTGAGAFAGNIMFQSAPPHMLAFFEGLAAGAMLAMIAETMMPEAYEHGGPVVGMATILGFLSAIFVKTFEHAG